MIIRHAESVTGLESTSKPVNDDSRPEFNLVDDAKADPLIKKARPLSAEEVDPVNSRAGEVFPVTFDERPSDAVSARFTRQVHMEVSGIFREDFAGRVGGKTFFRSAARNFSSELRANPREKSRDVAVHRKKPESRLDEERDVEEPAAFRAKPRAIRTTREVARARIRSSFTRRRGFLRDVGPFRTKPLVRPDPLLGEKRPTRTIDRRSPVSGRATRFANEAPVRAFEIIPDFGRHTNPAAADLKDSPSALAC